MFIFEAVMVLGRSSEWHLQPRRALLLRHRPGSAGCQRPLAILIWVRLCHLVHTCLPRCGDHFGVEPIAAELFVGKIDPHPLESGSITLERGQLNGAYSFFIYLD